jgi:hypothetical protein
MKHGSAISFGLRTAAVVGLVIDYRNSNKKNKKAHFGGLLTKHSVAGLFTEAGSRVIQSSNSESDVQTTNWQTSCARTPW